MNHIKVQSSFAFFLTSRISNEKLGSWKPYGNVPKQNFDILKDYIIFFLKQYTFMLPIHEV